MKRIISMLVTGAFLASLITNQATAQGSKKISFTASVDGPSREQYSPAPSGNESIDKSTIKGMKASLKAAKASLKITNHIDRNFSNVSSLKFHTEDKLVIASFKVNGKSARVVYDDRGSWRYSVTSYPEEEMSGTTRSLVKNAYPGYNITLVQEIKEGDVMLEKVHLENARQIKHILVCNDELMMYAAFDKSR